MKRNNFERDFLRAHPYCEYCKALGTREKAVYAVRREYGEKELYVSLCKSHFERLQEIEGK